MRWKRRALLSCTMAFRRARRGPRARWRSRGGRIRPPEVWYPLRVSSESWSVVRDRLSSCRACHPDGVEPGARPLFVRQDPTGADLLFVLEAPNRGDTFDAGKGYLTVDPGTDPSGVFFHELYMEVLGEPIERLAVTNAALCLPRRQTGRHPVTTKMMTACSANLRDQISALNPLVVAPLGGLALQATRLIEDHGFRSVNGAVGRATPWAGRILFPLFHTGMLARNGPTGRKTDQQRADWASLRAELAAARAVRSSSGAKTT